MGLHLPLGYVIGICLAALLHGRIGFRRRAAVARRTWWLLLMMGFVLMMWSLIHSTTPSFARRVTTTTTVSSCTRVKRRRSTRLFIHLDRAPGGPVFLDTEINAPVCWSSTAYRSDDVYEIVYLERPTGWLPKEAIAISVVAGPDKGWHGEVDARPFGTWLGVPFGTTLFVMGMLGLNLRRKDQKRRRIEDRRALARSARAAPKL